MWKTGVAAAIVLCFAQTAWAGNLVIVGGPITWIPSAEPSCQFVLGVDNTGASGPLIGWQLRCEIVPALDAIGTVSFGAINAPPNYVFGDLYRATKTAASTSSMLVATDDITNGGDPFDLLTEPVTVLETGMGLLEVELTSFGAAGRFDVVVAVETETDSIWWSDTLVTTAFDINTPGWPSPIVESVVFGIPEPSDVVLLLSGVIVLAIGWLIHFKTTNGSFFAQVDPEICSASRLDS